MIPEATLRAYADGEPSLAGHVAASALALLDEARSELEALRPKYERELSYGSALLDRAQAAEADAFCWKRAAEFRSDDLDRARAWSEKWGPVIPPTPEEWAALVADLGGERELCATFQGEAGRAEETLDAIREIRDEWSRLPIVEGADGEALYRLYARLDDALEHEAPPACAHQWVDLTSFDDGPVERRRCRLCSAFQVGPRS